MQRIFKYGIELVDRQTLCLPRGAEILSVINQRNNIRMYALVDDENADHGDLEDVEIFVVETGRPFMYADESVFVGSVSMHNGKFVWHIFRRIYELDG